MYQIDGNQTNTDSFNVITTLADQPSAQESPSFFFYFRTSSNRILIFIRVNAFDQCFEMKRGHYLSISRLGHKKNTKGLNEQIKTFNITHVE